MSEPFDVAVIGAGAAGMMCASVAGQRGRRVVLIDHSPKLAEKIRISGGGRCNFTNTDASWPHYLSQNPHFCRSALYGPYWSITRYNDIMTVDTTHQVFSSDAHLGGITIQNFDEDFVLPMFIAMDQPKHDIQRKTVSPIVSPANLGRLEGIIRERVCQILDALPIDEPVVPILNTRFHSQ